MILRLVRLLSMIINLVGSFVIVYLIVAFLIRRGSPNVLTGATLAVIGPGIVLFWCAAYMGTWISIAERNRQKFIKSFLLLDVSPGLVGALFALLGIGI